MKKSLYILLTLCFLFTSCSSDEEEVQDYTSFTFVYYADVAVFPNCVAAYKKDNKYYKIENLGDLKKGIQSKEVIVKDESIKEIYLFTDYNGVVQFDAIYSLKNNRKNNFEIKDGTRGIGVTDKSDAMQYPQ